MLKRWVVGFSVLIVGCMAVGVPSEWPFSKAVGVPSEWPFSKANGEVLPEWAVWVRVTAPGNELDVNRITVTVRSLASNELVESRVVDYEERNKRYGGDPSQLDNPDMERVLIEPHIFGSGTELYVIDLQFYDLLGAGEVEIEACAIDIQGNEVCEATEGRFWMRVHLPVIMR